ncbi:MAG TPA: hypothetical protein VG225_13820 [Terracidiphilus sp.]|jgi:hypothetical protein|nr:hypothetical protein [Terracidiphilus sp.]
MKTIPQADQAAEKVDVEDDFQAQSPQELKPTFFLGHIRRD